MRTSAASGASSRWWLTWFARVVMRVHNQVTLLELLTALVLQLQAGQRLSAVVLCRYVELRLLPAEHPTEHAHTACCFAPSIGRAAVGATCWTPSSAACWTRGCSACSPWWVPVSKLCSTCRSQTDHRRVHVAHAAPTRAQHSDLTDKERELQISRFQQHQQAGGPGGGGGNDVGGTASEGLADAPTAAPGPLAGTSPGGSQLLAGRPSASGRSLDTRGSGPPAPLPQQQGCAVLVTTDVCLRAVPKGLQPIGASLLVQYDLPSTKVRQRRAGWAGWACPPWLGAASDRTRCAAWEASAGAADAARLRRVWRGARAAQRAVHRH